MDLDRELLGAVSHELRGPLNGVLGLSALLLNGTYGAITDKQRTVIEMVERSGRTLLLRIDAVVAFLGLMTDPPRPKLRPTDVHELADAATGEASVRNEVDPGTLLELDPTIVAPIVEELLANAVRNSPDGVVTITATARPPSIVITDTGRGVPDGREEDAFLPFVQVHGDEGNDEHTGLGLARCRALAAAHGGTVRLSSNPGGGCIVALML